MSIAGAGYFRSPLSIPSRLVLLTGACMMLVPEIWSDILGMTIIGLTILMEIALRRKETKKCRTGSNIERDT
jgi:TRAP-type uncharacterized transport system fused permease subunit